MSTEQKDQELDTDQDIAKRVGAERAAKDHMPPTMFRLVRTIVLLVSDTIYPCFLRMAFVGFMRMWLDQSTWWPLSFPKRCPLRRYPLPDSAVDSGVRELDGKHSGSSRV